MREPGLDRECEVLTRAIARSRPTDYVKEQYRRAHTLPALAGPPMGIDRILCGAARRGTWLARMADAYAGRFARRGLYRTKSVLLVGLLESSPPHFRRYERVPTTRVLALAAMGWAVLGEVVALGAGVLVFGVPHLLAGVGATKGDG